MRCLAVAPSPIVHPDQRLQNNSSSAEATKFHGAQKAKYCQYVQRSELGVTR